MSEQLEAGLGKESVFPQAKGFFPEKIHGTFSLQRVCVCVCVCVWLKGQRIHLSAPSCLLLLTGESSPQKALINFPELPGCYLAPPGQLGTP